jgi:pilus assembly protein Flp/PilA
MDLQCNDDTAPLAALRRLWRDESGMTAVEYGLLAALLALAVFTVLGPLSDSLVALFDVYILPALQAALGG